MEHMGPGGISIWQIAALILWLAVVIFPFWKIFAKAGKPGWLSLFMVVPVVNLVMLYYLAFSKWSSVGANK